MIANELQRLVAEAGAPRAVITAVPLQSSAT